jgi:hypothetical protein
MECGIVGTEKYKSFTLYAEQADPTKGPLASIYNAANIPDEELSTQNNGTGLTAAANRYAEVRNQIIGDINQLNVAYDSVSSSNPIPKPLQEAIIVMIASLKEESNFFISSFDFRHALEALTKHPQIPPTLLNNINYWHDQNNLQQLLGEGVEQYNFRNADKKATICTPIEIMPSDTYLLVTRQLSWTQLRLLSGTCAVLNKRLPQGVEQQINEYVNRKAKDRSYLDWPVCFDSQAGISYVQNNILNCGPNTILLMKAGKLNLEGAKKHYATSPEQFEMQLDAQLLGKLTEKQFAALKKYIGDGLFSLLQFQALTPEGQNELAVYLENRIIQKYIDSIALLNNISSAVEISDILRFVRVLNKKRVTELLETEQIGISALFNASEEGARAVNDPTVWDKLIKTGLMSPHIVLSLRPLIARALCVPVVKSAIIFHSLEIKQLLNAKNHVLSSLLDQDVCDNICISTYKLNPKSLISVGEVFILNENGHKALRDPDARKLFSNIVSLESEDHAGNADYKLGRKTLFEYWHVLKGKVEADWVYRHTTPDARRLLDEGEYNEYVSTIKKSVESCVIS